MNRRAVLAAIAANSVGLAGCLDDESEPEETPEPVAPGLCNADESYEQCNRLVVDADSFPLPVRCEINAVLADGWYETGGTLHLAQAMDVTHGYVRSDGIAYQPVVSRDGAATRLEFDEPDMLRRRTPVEMPIVNETEDERTVAVTWTRDGEPIVEETVSVAAGETSRIETTDEFGSYDVHAETDRGLQTTFTTSIGLSAVGSNLVVADDGFGTIPIEAGLVDCRWMDE